MVGMRFGHAGRHRAHAHFRHQLDADPRRRVGVLQVVDQLSQIFDRIDVVMRRRADQADAGRGIANAGDVLVDLAARQLASFTRLGALRDLDLHLVGIGQVPDRHTKAPRCDLLDSRAAGVAVGQHLETLRVFAPFTRVALASHAIHRDRQRFVRFG